MKIYRLVSILLLVIVVLSGWGCRYDECKVDYPSVAYVNDEIIIKIHLFKNEILGINPAIAMQFLEDWTFISLTSNDEYINFFEISDSAAKDAQKYMGLKKGYKWIG
jgi:hypothetical protein